MTVAIRAAAALWLLAVASGCAASHGPQDDLEERQRAYFGELAEQAANNGASQKQIDALTEAASTGELTPDMVADLYAPLFECFAALGGTGEVHGTVEAAPGVSVPDYRVAFDADADAAGGVELDNQVRACKDRHVEFVWQALYLQPKAVEAREAQALTLLPAIRECLADVDVALPEEPTPEQIDDALVEGRLQGVRCTPEELGG